MKPTKITNETIRKGVEISPEGMCFPLKVTTGNFIESIEAGAERIIMVGGIGPCRFGYYAELQKLLLRRHGYKCEIVIVEPPSPYKNQALAVWDFFGFFTDIGSVKNKAKAIKIVNESFQKAKKIDHLESYLIDFRAKEKYPGETERHYKEAINIMLPANTMRDIELAFLEAKTLMESVTLDENWNGSTIGFIGEFYVVLEAFINMEVEKWLNQQGVAVERGIYVTDWVDPSGGHKISHLSKLQAHALAKGYINRPCGGDCTTNVGHSRFYIENRKVDGLLQMFPFGCMPDTIAKTAIEKLTEDFDIPFLSLLIDEQTGRAGMETRLEAFTDILSNRREKNGAKKSNLARA